MPVAVHLLYSQFLDDNDPIQREASLRMGHRVLEACDELWLYGSRISTGMAMELAAFLTIRFEDTSILDFLRYACAFFITKQQFYEWRYTPNAQK